MGAPFAAAMLAHHPNLMANPIDPPAPGWIELERPAIPGATRAFYPAALSGDGHIVVGREWYSDSEDGLAVSRAAVWDRGQLSWLPEPARAAHVPEHALAYAIDYDGSVIAGLASMPEPTGRTLNSACVWYDSIPFQPRHELTSDVQPVFISDVNSSGNVYVGRALIDEQHQAAFVARLGAMQLLEPITGAAGEATAVAVSHDGRVIVGYSTNAQGIHEAVRWVDEQPMRLGVLPWWATASYATDVNQDGSVIVGRIMAGDLAMHFRWENGQYQVLEGLEPIGPVDVPYARAIRTNADGSVIVGGFNDRAFYWSKPHGTRPLRTVAIQSGIAIPCCTRLLNALDVSNDGRTVLVRGRGRDLVITLGPPTVEGDANGDGVVNLADLNLLLQAFGLDGSDADLNGDGAVNLADLNLLLQEFGQD
jgi:probable HAF family extracellular repeat protein